MTGPRSLLSLGSEDRQIALTIMEWAYYHQDAEAAAPGLVVEYRKFMESPLGQDETRWRRAFDMALDVWSADRDAKKRLVF